MNRVPSDVVKGIFHFLGAEEFDADIPRIHSVFFNMGQEVEEIKPLMATFVFDESKTYPYSKTISLALDRLQKSNLLHCQNPRLSKFKISDSLAKVNSVEDLFNTEEIDALKKGAYFFKDKFRNQI